MPESSSNSLKAVKQYIREWWYTLIIVYVAFAIVVFLFCVLMTIILLGVSAFGGPNFLNGVIIYEAGLVVVFFIGIVIASRRKRKILK